MAGSLVAGPTNITDEIVFLDYFGPFGRFATDLTYRLPWRGGMPQLDDGPLLTPWLNTGNNGSTPRDSLVHRL